MINLKEAYHISEEQTRSLFFSVLSVLFVLVLLSVFISPLATLAVTIGLFFIVATIFKPFWTLSFLAFYLPFEPFLLKWVPDEIYLPARVFSEALVYLMFIIVGIRYLFQKASLPSTPINLPFTLFLTILGASAIMNFVAPLNALFGIRSIVRFMLVFFTVIMLRPSKQFIRKLTMWMLAIVVALSVIGIAQAAFGGTLDEFLLPSQTRTYGEFSLTEGTVQFWDPGSRVFATLGRYDRLGTFLAFFLLIGIGLLYERRIKTEQKEFWPVFLLGIPTLALTFSRSSWFGFLLGFLFIALWLKRDKRIMIATAAVAIAIAGYLAFSNIVVGQLTDIGEQTFVERFFEAFSYERWRGEYYGLGRLFWIVETTRSVVPAAPLFGHGPGTYGAGASILFHNTGVFDELGLPFGVYGTEGYIDNNWFSIWGETGTIGFILYIWIFLSLFLYSIKILRESYDPFTRAIALGFIGAIIAFSLNAFLATFFEVRSLAIYFWMYAGFVVVMGQREKIT